LERLSIYKYLEDFVVQSTEVKHQILSEYHHRCRKVLSSKLHEINKCIAINAYALPVVSYMGGIIKWIVDELTAADCRTRKLFTMHKDLHLQTDVDRLYLLRNCGDRNLKSFKNSIQLEEQSLALYVWTNSHQEPLVTALQVSGIFSTSLSSFQSEISPSRHCTEIEG